MTTPDYTAAELTAAREHLADDVLCGGTKPSLADCLSERDHEELGPLLVKIVNVDIDWLFNARHNLRNQIECIVAAHFAHPDQEWQVRLRACELRETYAEAMAEGV